MSGLESTEAMEREIVVCGALYPAFAKLFYRDFRAWRHRVRGRLGHDRVILGAINVLRVKERKQSM